MNPLDATFEDYQAQYETILPLKVRTGLTYVQIKVHNAVVFIDEFFQAPDCIVRVMQFVVATFSLFPTADSYLEGPKQFCKDAKNFTNFVKGLKSVDGFLNFKFHWKPIVMNISGLTLFIVSGLSLAERFQVYNVASIKTSLLAVPVFGILPWGGLLPFSIVGLMGMISIFAVEKMSRLKIEEMRIKSDKLPFWSTPLDLSKIKEKQCKFHAEILNLQDEINAYEALIQEGTELEVELIQQSDQPRPLLACQKALSELNKTMEKAQEILTKVEQKAEKWDLLEKNWRFINFAELENFRQAKQTKWELKLGKVESEKRATMLSITNSMIILGRQALVIVSVATGYGIVTLPFALNIGLDAYVAGTGMVTFLMKRSIKKIKVPSINLDSYHLYTDPNHESLTKTGKKAAAAA